VNSLALLSQLLRRHQTKRRLTEYQCAAGFLELERLGLVQEAGDVESVLCDGCDDGHSGDVAMDGDQPGWWCPECGFCECEPAELKAFRLNVDLLIEMIAERLGGSERQRHRENTELLRYIGKFRHQDETVEVLLWLGLDGQSGLQSAREVLVRLSTSRHRTILLPDGSPLSGTLLDRAALISISEVIAIERNELTINVEQIAQRSGIQAQKPTGRPSPFEPHLSDLIRSRAESQIAATGQNAELRGIRLAWGETHPTKTTPSDATIRRALVSYRGAS